MIGVRQNNLTKKFKVLNNNNEIFLSDNLGMGWALGMLILLLEHVFPVKYANF